MLFYCLLEESYFSEAQKKRYAICTLYFSSDDNIKMVNVENYLTNYISDNSTFLDIESPDISKLIHGFSLMEVLFTSINYNAVNKELNEYKVSSV